MLNIHPRHLDALREVTNIASGNAATALSQLLKKRIDMSTPEVEVKQFQDVANKVGDEDEAVVATMLKAYGDINGNVLLVVKEKSSAAIAASLLKDLVGDEYSNEMFLSVFQEIGNILGNSYLNAMGSFLDINVLSTVPYISVDMLFSIVSSAYVAANETEDYVIDINCKLIENEIEFDLDIFFILSNSSLNLIFEKADKLLGY